jgi:hypothetical protein
MRFHRKVIVAITASLLALPALTHATALSKKLDVQDKGLTLVSSGAGGFGLGSGAVNLTVNIQGPVKFARLYWVGRQRPCDTDSGGNCAATPTPYRDQQMVFDGHPVSGAIIGTETQPISSGGPILNLTYFYDVTQWVSAKGTGTQNFTFSDGDIANNLWRLDGVGLIVGYDDPANANTYRVLLYDGADEAYGRDPVSGDPQVTAPVAMDHGISSASRAAEFTIFVGDTEANRPDRIDISNNPSVLNSMVSNGGPEFEYETLPFTIPSGVGTTSVQLKSENDGGTSDDNPDSLVWALLAMRVQVPAAGGSGGDTTPPICVLNAVRNGPPTQIDIKVQDGGSGIASIVVNQSNNADTPVPPFTVGTNDTMIITATKINQSQRSQVELTVTDVAGNSTVCDPILALLVREPGKDEVQTFNNVAGAEHVLTIYNGTPGLAHMELWVNGQKTKLKGLRDGETATFDLGSKMKAQGNTISVKVGGRPGSSANMMLWDGKSK